MTVVMIFICSAVSSLLWACGCSIAQRLEKPTWPNCCQVESLTGWVLIVNIRCRSCQCVLRPVLFMAVCLCCVRLLIQGQVVLGAG